MWVDFQNELNESFMIKYFKHVWTLEFELDGILGYDRLKFVFHRKFSKKDERNTLDEFL